MTYPRVYIIKHETYESKGFDHCDVAAVTTHDPGLALADSLGTRVPVTSAYTVCRTVYGSVYGKDAY